MRFAAIDLGATFIKSALLDADSFTISRVERVPFPPFTQGLPPGHREVSSENVFRTAKEKIDRLLAAAPDCAGILSCGQMHGLVLTDKRGANLTDFISWMDERAQPHLEALVSRVASLDGSDLIPEITAGSTIAILFWLAAGPGIPKGAVPCSLPDFILSRLCGSEPKCEPTMASGFGVFDASSGAWHREAIEELGLGHVRWPRIARYNEPIGTYSFGAKRIPVYASLGDQQCALLGSLLKPGELSVNVSTGSQVSTVRDRFEPGDYQIRPYFDGLFLNTVTHLPAGRAINKLIHLISELSRLQGLPLKDPWHTIDEATAGIASTDLRVDLAGGGISNVRDSNLTLGHLFRAAFENMAENYYAAARELDPDMPWNTMVFSGGLIRKSSLLQRLIKEKFDLPTRTSPSQEDTLHGLLVLSAVLSGQTNTTVLHQ